MTRKSWILPVFLAVLAGCAGIESGSKTAERPALDGAVAAEAIRDFAKFVEPIEFEIWSFAESPTVKNLASRGYLRIDGAYQVGLTDKSRALGVREYAFQSDMPVYFFPVGQRQLLDVTEISDTPNSASHKVVRFTYRKAANALGLELLESGTRLDQLTAERIIEGRAFLAAVEGGWEVEVLEL